MCVVIHHHHHHHLSLNREGSWGTTNDFTASFLHFFLFSNALKHWPNSRPDHSLLMSSHLFLCLPCLLPPFTVPQSFYTDVVDGVSSLVEVVGDRFVPVEFSVSQVFFEACVEGASPLADAEFGAFGAEQI